MLNIFAIFARRKIKKLLDQAEQFYKEKNYWSAITYTEKALNIDESNSYIFYLLSKNKYAFGNDSYHPENYLDEAYRAIKKAIDLETESNNLLQYYRLQASILKSLYNKHKHDSLKSSLQETFKKILEIEPNNFQNLVNLADIQITETDKIEFLALTKKILKIAPDGKDILLRYIGELENQLAYSATIECYQQLLETEPNNVEFYLKKAICHIIINQPKKAIVDLDKAINIVPEFSSAWLQKAIAHTRLAEYELAQECCHKVDVRELSPKEKGEYWFNYALVLAPSENVEEANEAIDKAIALEPTNLTFLEAKGLILEALGLFAEARSIYSQMKSIEPIERILKKEALACLNAKEYSPSQNGEIQ